MLAALRRHPTERSGGLARSASRIAASADDAKVARYALVLPEPREDDTSSPLLNKPSTV